MGSMKMACVLFFCFLFIAAGEMEMAEARTCESASTKFNGVCVRSSNCATICQSEGFADGQCQGVRRRCICHRPC